MSEGKPRNRPIQDENRDESAHPLAPRPVGREPRGVDQTIADADKRARIGSEREPVRNTPPAGEWNDTTTE
jgi:hypothetical protein